MSNTTSKPPDKFIHHGPGRRRDDEAKNRILDAALGTLEEFGFATTTVELIASRAGSGKATIYRWWPNKAAVIIDAVQGAIAQDLAFPETGDLTEDFRLHLRSLAKLFNGRRGRIVKSLLVAVQNDTEICETFQALWRKSWRRATKSGLGNDPKRVLRGMTDLDAVLDLVYGSLYYRLLIGGNAVTTEYVDTVADIILRGILKT